jgi:hypothetical protein
MHTYLIAILAKGEVEVSGQTKIRDFNQSIVGINENIAGLQISMQNTIAMEIIQAFHNLLENVPDFVPWD